MYCPQCAAQYTEGAKFCRSCGTELEAVALVLSSKSAKPAKGGGKKAEAKTRQDWMEKHVEGVKNVASGLILILVSLLIAIPLALFVPADVPWVLVWMVFFGWMTVWGGIETANGVGSVIEAKGRLRMMGAEGGGPAADSPPRQLSSPGEPVTVADTSSTFRPAPALSVTEGTTRNLDDLVEK